MQNHQPEALLKLITEEHGYRNYHGRLTIEAVAQSPADRLRIVNVVDLEDYVASVVGSEMQSNQHEALKAQAVIARTYALRTMHEAESGQSRGSGSDTYQPYIFTDDEQYQVYLGEHISKPHYSKAANDTRSEVLTWSGQLILTPFFSTCGGSTSPNEDVWQGSPRRYLRAVQDNAVCDLSPHFTWSLDVYKEQLSAWVEDTFGVRPESFRLDYDEGRRVRRVHLVSDGGEKTITGNDLRLMVNDRLHKLAMKSTRFTWEERPGGVLHIRGIGLGHGVGLCQYGAMGLAASGWVYDDILRFYFSGTKVVHLQSEEGQRLTFD